MTSQQIAEELARKCACAIPPDVLEEPLPSPTRLDYATKKILQSIPLVELLECVKEFKQMAQNRSYLPSCISNLEIKLKQLGIDNI